MWSLDDGTVSSEMEWFRLETNWDHWKVAKDGRRAATTAMMSSMSSANVSQAGLFSLLSTPPVLATDTVYTAEMVPANGSYTTTIRE